MIVIFAMRVFMLMSSVFMSMVRMMVVSYIVSRVVVLGVVVIVVMLVVLSVLVSVSPLIFLFHDLRQIRVIKGRSSFLYWF